MNSLLRRGLAAATLALVCAVAPACGSEGEPPPTGRPALPDKAEFVREANFACAREKAGVAEEAATFVERQRPRKPRPVLIADVAHFVLLPAIERQIWRLYQLIESSGGSPRGDDERIDEMLSSERLAIDEVATTHRISSLRDVYRRFGESAKMFRAYGLGACANGPGPPPGVTIPTP